MSASLALNRLPTIARPGRRAPDWLAGQLPLGLVEDDFLRRFLGIFQTMADSVIEHVDNLAFLLDPTVAPAAMVSYLGSWLGEDLPYEAVDDLVLRRWVDQAAALLRWRGTARGLTELLELLTQRPVEVFDSGGVYPEGEAPRQTAEIAVHIRELGVLDRAGLVELVRREIPANVVVYVFLGDERIWPGELTDDAPNDAPNDEES